MQTDNFLSVLYKIANRNLNLVYTVETGRPVTVIGASVVSNLEQDELVSLVVERSNIQYKVLNKFNINTAVPQNFIEVINRISLLPGDKVYVQLTSQFGSATNPDADLHLSFVRQPKLF